MADVTFTFGGDATSLKQALEEIKSELGRTKESVHGLSTQFAIAFTAIQGAIATAKTALSSLGGMSNAAAAFEQTSLAFNVMMGDAAAAAAYVAELREYAASTPFSLSDISGAAKTLLAMGTAAEKSIGVIRKLGDIASVSGKPLKDLAFLYAKAQNAGLSNEVAESLEMQGVPLRRLIAEMRGLSFEEVFKGISQRQFNIADLDAALDKLTGSGGLLENMTLRQSQTFGGALSTLMDNVAALAVEWGTPINAALLPAMQELTAFIAFMLPAARELAQGLASAFTGALEAVTPLLSGLSSLAGSMGGVNTMLASVAAGLLMYAGKAQQAAVATASVKAQAISLDRAFRGLSVASVASALKSGLASVAAAFRSTLAGLRASVASTLAGMKLAWSVAWSTMAAVTRAAMVAVKAAIASTGLGLIIVGIGEALGALYSWFMKDAEAAKQAAESARQFERTLKDIGKQAGKVKSYEQMESFLDSMQQRIDDLRAQREEAYAAEEWERGEQLTRQLDTLWEQEARYKKALPLQIEKAQAAQREAAAIRAQAEAAAALEKKLEAARERMAELVGQQEEKEREQYLGSLSYPQQITLRLADAGGFQSIGELKAAMERMERRGLVEERDLETYQKLAATYNKIVELRKKEAQRASQAAKEEKKKEQEADKKAAAWEEARKAYDTELALLRAETQEDEKRLEILKQQQRVAQLAAEYRRKGFADAEAMARRMVEAELSADIARERQAARDKQGAGRMPGSWIQDSRAAVGGGGASYLVGGGPMLTESKKHTALLKEVRDAVRKAPPIKVSGNVEAVIGT